jgi:hypothetical protein
LNQFLVAAAVADVNRKFAAASLEQNRCGKIDNPGYNRDRGPVIVPGMRLHVEL